jgi:hypothetical protein
VNPATGREREFATASGPTGELIYVIGAGPAGLSYASLVAEHNHVVVLERESRPGGALRYAALAPRFNNVGASEASLLAYVDELQRACSEHGVTLRLDTDASKGAEGLRHADRVIVATGASYRYGIGPLVRWMLRAGVARRGLAGRISSSERVRQWLYYRARSPTGARIARRLGLDPQKVTVIGDAARAGKAADANRQAFEAACFVQPATTGALDGRTEHRARSRTSA